MNARRKRSTLAAVIAAAMALPASAALAQGTEQLGADLREWDQSRLYRNGWSAEEMIGADVRGANGEEIGEVKDIFVDNRGYITKVVVEVGGFLELGDQHIGVPWRDVRIGPDMKYVQVPLQEVQSGSYALHGRVPQGEEVRDAGAWRVNEMIGDYASLEDVRRYGLVTDVIFNDQGRAQGIIVSSGAGWGGPGWAGAGPGWYAYPYSGYYADRNDYPLPYRRDEIAGMPRFDYVQLGEQSALSDANNQPSKQAQARQAQRVQRQASVAPDAELVSRVQEQLRSKGYDIATVDGVWGEQTRAQLRSFQQKQGLEASGQLTPPTLSALGVQPQGGSGAAAAGASAR